MEPVDHYGYWHQSGTRRSDLLDRERVHLELLDQHLQPGTSVLDAGCGDGRFLELLNRQWRDLTLVGADYSQLPLEAAGKRGFEVHRANFEAALPFEDEQFDVVNAAQVVEHIYNPDLFLRELRRVLRHDGHLVVSTPNLCAWFNRVLVPLGVQPIFYESSTESTMVGAGILRRFKRGDRPVGHVRLFTLRALSDLLERAGFEIVKAHGSVFDEGVPPRLLPVDRAFALRPSLASLLVVLARPTR
jgi:2-polyprenyl-3-methyl-5-hydroxy-6-metoxy-1,4-benzoquinol methylase